MRRRRLINTQTFFIPLISLFLVMRIVQAAPAVPTDLAYIGPSASTSGASSVAVVSAETKMTEVPLETDTEEFAPNGPVTSISSITSSTPPLGATSQLPAQQTAPRIPANLPTSAAAPAGEVSYAIAQPSVVTLQIVDGKLVPATEGTTQYSIALPTSGVPLQPFAPGTTPIAGSVRPLARPIPLIPPTIPMIQQYLNPLIQYSSQIIASIPPTCVRPCTSFQTHFKDCTTRFPPLPLPLTSSASSFSDLSSGGQGLTAKETESNMALSTCLCDYTYQAQTCGQCFVKVPEVGVGSLEWFQGFVAGCQAVGEGKTKSLVDGGVKTGEKAVVGTVGVGTAGVIGAGTAGTIGAGTAGTIDAGTAGTFGKTVAGTTGGNAIAGESGSLGITGSKSTTGGTGTTPADLSSNSTNLEGVDRDALAAICNATGLAISDPKSYESCVSGTNVAAILNTTDTILREKLSEAKGKEKTSSVVGVGGVKDDSSTGERVEEYCDIVHLNDFFWAQTCGKTPKTGGALSLAGGRVHGVVAVVVVVGLWLLV